MTTQEDPKPACRDCRFAGPRQNFEEHQCRRRAPSARMVSHSSDTREIVPAWPVMLADDWCGEFEPRHQQGVSVRFVGKGWDNAERAVAEGGRADHLTEQHLGALRQRMQADPRFALSFLVDTGISNPDGTLTERYGGRAEGA